MKPSKQEYESAINANKIHKTNIALEREDIDRHLDTILTMRKRIQEYEKYIEHNNEIIVKYELYEEYERMNEVDE
jgi:hypothetical protein